MIFKHSLIQLTSVGPELRQRSCREGKCNYWRSYGIQRDAVHLCRICFGQWICLQDRIQLFEIHGKFLTIHNIMSIPKLLCEQFNHRQKWSLVRSKLYYAERSPNVIFFDFLMSRVHMITLRNRATRTTVVLLRRVTGET